MLKKTLIVSVLFLLIFTFSNTAKAAVTIDNPLGYYVISNGSLTMSVNFPNIISISVKLPKLALIQSQAKTAFAFLYWNGLEYADYGIFGLYSPVDLSSILPLPIPISTEEPIWVGEWQVTSPYKFRIVPIAQDDEGYYYTLDTTADLEDYINNLLSSMGGLVGMITVNVTQYSFTGSMDSSDKLKLALNLGISVDAAGLVTGTIKVTGKFDTLRGSMDAPQAASLAASNTISSKPSGKAGIANWVVDVIKKLPLEQMMTPAN